jgi:hypothetical protein
MAKKESGKRLSTVSEKKKKENKKAAAAQAAPAAPEKAVANVPLPKRHAKRDMRVGVSMNAMHSLARKGGCTRTSRKCLRAAKFDIENNFIAALAEKMHILKGNQTKTYTIGVLKAALAKMGVNMTGFDEFRKSSVNTLSGSSRKSPKMIKASEESK